MRPEVVSAQDQIVELVPGQLYRVGGTATADGRISWLPAGREGYEPINAYLRLYSAHIVESADSASLFANPQHEHTRALLDARPESATALTGKA